MFIFYIGNKSYAFLFMFLHNSCMGVLSVGLTIKTHMKGVEVLSVGVTIKNHR